MFLLGTFFVINVHILHGQRKWRGRPWGGGPAISPDLGALRDEGAQRRRRSLGIRGFEPRNPHFLWAGGVQVGRVNPFG